MKKFSCPQIDNDSFYCEEKKANGYTVENNLIVEWDDDKHKDKGFIKYISDPYQKSATGDPYPDFKKVTGGINDSVLPEALHPLVAACPEIIVNMEKLILSKNTNTSQQTGQTINKQNSKTIGITTSNSNSNSNTISASADFEVSILGPKVSVSGSYSHQWTNTVSTSNSNTETTGENKVNSWTSSLNINHAETAFLNGNVRYINAGTAPIYEAKPTINFVLGTNKKAKTVATASAKTNTVANVILPDRSYPEKTQNAIAFNTNDDFNSHPITLNFDQVNELNNGELLQIETTQISGFCGVYNDQNVVLENNLSWEYFMPQIISKTATIKICFENEHTLIRRIAARKAKDYEKQFLPELTIKEAIELAFPGAKINPISDGLSYKHLYNYTPSIQIDYFTENNIKNQKEKNQNKHWSFFNAKLVQGMNITLIPQHDDQELLQLVEKFLTNIGEEQIDLSILDPNQTWEKALDYIKNLINEKIGLLSYKRIKNLEITESDKVILSSTDQNNSASQKISFVIGKLGSKQITINFINIFSDEKLFEKVKNFLNNYVKSNAFDLAIEPNTEIAWKEVIKDINNVLKDKFGKINFERIKDLKIENEDELININADENGIDNRKVKFTVGKNKSEWITMYFKNIHIEPTPKSIELKWRLWEIDSKVSGDTWLNYIVHDFYSKEITLLEFKNYRKKTWDEFVKKYPKVNIQLDSQIKHWDDSIKKKVQETMTFETKNLFKSNGKETVTIISDFYFREFLTGGSEGRTEIHTRFKDNSFFIKTSAHAGGGGNSWPKRFEKASIALQTVTFYS